MGDNSVIDFGKVKQLVDEGYIKALRHPSAPLTIYNYSVKTQYDWHWTAETKACRGLIVNDQGQIVARPFEKFFSVEQLQDTPLPLEPFEVFEKLDGSLGVSYWPDGQPAIATRGSFVSEQARKATEILRGRYGSANLYPSLTYLFEIIYPANRVVIDYGGTEDLFLLAVIDTASGRELPLCDFADLGFPIVKRYDGLKEFSALKRLEQTNQEGFVVRFESGFRVKIKFEEYKRLHKLITGVNPRHIWEEMRAGRSLDALIERVPDEYFQWVKNVEHGLLNDYRAIEARVKLEYRDGFATRKDAALYYQKCTYPSLLFAKMDGKDYSDYIWRMIRPEAAATFRCDVDAN